jgi:hypothetical protein
VSDIATYLANIPGSVVTGVTTSLQATLDAISNALGVSGTGHTAANVGTYLGAIPGGNLTGALNTAVTISGNALSTLFNGSGILASQLTGGMNTAVTIGGQAVSTIFNGSGQFIGVINSAATGALNGAITIGGTAISTLSTNWNAAATNAAGLVQGINNAAAGVSSGASALLADAQTNLAALLGSAPANLQGLLGVFGQSATNTAFSTAAAAMAAQAAQIAAQQSAFNAVFNVAPATAGNINLTIDFTSMSNASNMSGVMSPGSTDIGITSGAAQIQSYAGGGYTAATEVFPTPVVSDYVVASATLGSLNDLNAGIASPIVAARCNSGRTTMVFVEASYFPGGAPTTKRLYLCALVSGTKTDLAYSANVNLSTGGVVQLILGDPSSLSPYAMQILYNGTPVVTFTDSSHVSQLGASYRYVGLRMASNATMKTPAVRAVSYQDNPPPPAAYPFSGRPAGDADAKGRMYASSDCGRIDRDNGGAWENIFLGPKAWATEPPSSSWSTTTLGSATFGADLDGRKLAIPTSGGSDAWRIEYRTLSPASNYITTAYLELAHVPGNYMRSGLVLMDNSSVFIDFGIHYDSSLSGFYLSLTKWTNVTTFNSNYLTATLTVTGGIPNWLRFRDDGSNRYAEYSFNGVDWILFHSIGRTNYITPTRIGWGASNISSNAAVLRLRSLAL